jgi:uncharacterized protein
MILAVMSDSHDNLWNLRKALEIIKTEQTGMIIHCGDFVAPFMLVELETAGIPVHGVFGNNDGDKVLLTRMSLTSLKNITLHDLYGEVDIDGFHVGFAHQEIIAEGLASAGNDQVVCFGHSHTYLQKNLGRTVLLNPGEIMGKDGSPGFCLIDTITGEIRRMDLPGS